MNRGLVFVCIIQLRSTITAGRVLSGELYAQTFRNGIYLHLFTDCFMKVRDCFFFDD